MAKAWVYQDPKQVKRHGTEAASWYVGWYDPAGKKRCQSCGAGKAGKGVASKLARKVAAELLTGTYQSNKKKLWADFRQEYEAKALGGMSPGGRAGTVSALGHFERLINPKRMEAIRT